MTVGVNVQRVRAARARGVQRNAKLEKNAARAHVFAPLTKQCKGICRDEFPPHKLNAQGMCSACAKLDV